jgi:hypothetical protein
MTTMPAIEPPLPDLPLIREELLVEIEQRRLEGASNSELAELRRQYGELAQGQR